VADGLDVVAVGVEDEGAVVGGVVDRTRAGRAVVGAPGGECGGVEGVDGVAVAGGEGDVGVADDGAAAGVDSPERRQRRLLEHLAALVVADLDANVVEHGSQPTAATIER
jgi:hypothetical protein